MSVSDSAPGFVYVCARMHACARFSTMFPVVWVQVLFHWLPKIRQPRPCTIQAEQGGSAAVGFPLLPPSCFSLLISEEGCGPWYMEFGTSVWLKFSCFLLSLSFWRYVLKKTAQVEFLYIDQTTSLLHKHSVCGHKTLPVNPVCPFCLTYSLSLFPLCLLTSFIPTPLFTLSSWFHGKITREQAERLLYPPETGLFLVRESTNYPGDYTLCVSCDGKVEHYRIIYHNGKLTIDEEEYFENLMQLVEVRKDGEHIAVICSLILLTEHL